ncbi:hypothetical protein COV05_00475 [Candidatus Uhrbacteria bacterium CG10_big_fil_rev_8_21_14_0_10_48_16]|uniref:Uncharacterized protein n=1 Tax=Candidatus Uhrbacteria bacterium CG10_big_fil_rev_8_21_14_0_10_48_16 TaxID=1975038 RepID=A0A2M8LIB6_9BACT|nr:MAG: hypothetical protein COV05_00475 [Candidatus Uhrbacteria bacterium CG10_big_fil_rev_8_21_14_0_10_48_16]
MEKSRREVLLSELKDCELITNQDRVSLLLVLEGLKSACDIQLYSLYRFPGVKESVYKEADREYQKTISTVKGLLEKFHLPYELTFGEPPLETAYFQIGKDTASLQALLDSRDTEEEGRAFGIPDTAISQLADKNKSREILPAEVLSSDYIHFLDFILSKDHWQEELEFVKRRAEEVKRLAPDLYAKIILEGKNSAENSETSTGHWEDTTDDTT